MATTHVIIGNGKNVEAPRSVINEGLRDVLREGDAITVGWYGKPSEALAHVYDYVLEHEIEFILAHTADTNPPKAFTSAPHGIVMKVTNIPKTLVAHAEKGKGGKVLVLGEDEATDDDILAYTDIDPDVTLLNLGNGLVPIEVTVDDGTEPTGRDVLDEAEEYVSTSPIDEDPTDDGEDSSDPDPFTFSKEELENLPVKVLKRLAAQVLDDVPATGKAIVTAMEAKREELAKTVEEVQAEMDEADEFFGAKKSEENPLEVPEEFEEALRLAIKALAAEEVDNGPNRLYSLVRTKLEEAYLWYSYGSEVS